MFVRFNVFLFSLILLELALPANGEASDDDASHLFDEGITAFNEGKFDEAATFFRRANELKFNWKLLYNIAQSEAAAKRSGLALQAFEEYLTRGGDDIPLERLDEVTAEIKRLRMNVGMLDLKAPDGSAVYVDGELRGTLPLTGPVMVSAGIVHSVMIKQGDTVLLEQDVRLSGEQTRNLTVEKEVGDSSAKDTNTTATKITSDKPVSKNNKTGGLKLAGIITMAAGGAVLAGGFVVGGLGLSKAKGLDSDYPDGIPSSRQGEVDSAYTMATLSNIFIGVGGAAVVTGMILLIVGKKKRESQTVMVTPVAGPKFSGVMFEGRF